MSKPSNTKIIHGLLRLHFIDHNLRVNSASISKPSHLLSNGSSNFSTLTSYVRSQFPSKPTSTNLGLTRILSKHDKFSTGFRFVSFKTSEFGQKINGNFAKKVLEKPAAAVSSTFSRYRAAIGLQIDAFFRRNYLFLLGAGGVLVCALLWRIMFGIASTFVGISEGMAKYGFLALSSAIVAFADNWELTGASESTKLLKPLVAALTLYFQRLQGLYLRARYTINPDKVYRIAMTRLNTAAGILEVMGAPLSGTSLRAYVMSGGGLTLKNFKPSFRSKRCFLIFPIRGSERRGLVSVEVKKKKGQYDMKLLAVDIPMASGPDQRLFLIGDEEEYKVGGGLISELREPVVRAMAATKEFDNLDEIEEEEDAERELQEAERKHREEIEKIEKAGTQ
ncbi:hypothetical protein EZV62_025813 [Acer yangbiense]|uniref:Uncharacterized protein n=1 Tax=Acer yangbiense TaxID=1000413 RepID=A0A5C7GYV3_9ROSI|nr:hypothetical protein EZV62_025813 [Acer yangbiense]